MALSLQTVSNVAKAFNKGGYRLASKTVGEVVANMPKGAVSKTTVIVEHVSGETIKVESYLDKFGKAVKVNKNNLETGDCVNTFLEWERGYLGNGDLADIYLKTRTSGVKDGGTLSIFRNIETCPVDRITTIVESISKNQKSSGNSINELFTRAFIRNKGKVKEVSKLTKKTTTPTSSKTVVEKSGRGIPENDVEQITSYPYFDSVFFDKKDMVRRSVDVACQRQGVSPTKLSFPTVAETNKSGGWFNRGENTIAVTDKGLKGNKPYLFDTLEHEARHKWQHDLVDKLRRGELTHPQDIELAQKFEKEFANYINSNKDFDAYYKQLVEVDAREAGRNAQEAYKKVSKLMDRHFFCDFMDESFMASTI